MKEKFPLSLSSLVFTGPKQYVEKVDFRFGFFLELALKFESWKYSQNIFSGILWTFVKVLGWGFSDVSNVSHVLYSEDYYITLKLGSADQKCQLSLSSINQVSFLAVSASLAHYSLGSLAGLYFPFRFKGGKKKVLERQAGLCECARRQWNSTTAEVAWGCCTPFPNDRSYENESRNLVFFFV